MFSLLQVVRFLCLCPLGQPAASTSRAYGRSKIYNNKPLALDWDGGLHKLGCGAVVFLSDDNGATWYCCGGVEKSESAKNTYDGRPFRTFFLTSVFDKDGKNWVKEDKKVGLDLRLFQGYGVKAFSMKAFDARGDGAELRMLTTEQFLSRTNGYRITGCLPVVDSSLELTKPLVKFSSPADQLPGVVKEYREAFLRLPLDQQADCAFVPFVTSSRRSRYTPSAPVGKRKQLAACLAPPLPGASPSPLPTVRGGHDLAQCSSEATEYDDRLLYGRNVARDSVQEGATALIEQNKDEEDGGSCGSREDGGDYEYMDVGDENMQDQNMLGDDDVGITSEHGPCDIPAGSVGPAVGRHLSSPAICHSQGESQGGHDSQEHGGSKSRKTTRETFPSASAHKRQSRTDAVNEARGALIASQEARPPRKSSQGGRSGGRGSGRGGARKGKQIVRAEELRDSGDEGEGVGPRMPDDGDEPLQHAAPIDTTRCFFLEYDERGFAKQKVLPVLVDIMKIKRIPRGNILFNHRSLSANIVRGIENAIESSITTEPGAWDRPELVLAPVDRNEIVGGKGRRITPTEFFERDSSEFDWYTVCGQHTVEAMKTFVKKGSPAVDVYGLRAYSKVRVVYFGDDQTQGHFNVSAFNNTRENRAMMLSFEDALRDMRQWWIDNHRSEALKGKVSDKDAVAVAHQKKWQNFLRASMGKACDKAFVKQALENEYSKDWSNKLRGYMNLATFTEVVWPLVEKFFDMFNEGKLPVGDGKIPLDMPGRMEGRQPGPYTDETKGQRTLYHCIYARDGPKGSIVSWKDLCPSYFKNFGDLTCREREVALLLLMKGKVVATNVKVMPPRVNTECLLDIMRKERYMVRMFNYVVFRAEGRADDEWNDAFFMSYKDLEDRYGPNGLCAAEWEKERDKLHVSKVKTVPRRLGGVEEARQGSGLGPTAAMYKEAPFHFKVQSDVLRCLFRWEDNELILGTWKRDDRPSNDITRYGNIATAGRDMMVIVLHAEGGDLRKVTVAPHLVNDLTNVNVVEEKFGKCLGKHGGIDGDESVVYSIWERELGKLRSLCGSFVGEAEGVLLLGRAHAGLVWEFLLAGNNVIACDESAKDIAYLTKFIDILVKDDRFKCHVEKPRCKHRPNWDMFHKLGPKRLKMWEYLFRDMPQGQLDGKYMYRKAKATETLKHYHGALTGVFETFVARCEILKFDRRKDKLTSKDYAELAKSGDGFNPVDSEEDSSDSDLELGEDTCGGMVQAHDDGTVHSHGGSIPVAAPSVASMVAPSETAALQDVGRCGGNEEDDIEIPGEASTLAPGDAIPPGYWQSEAAIKAKAEELFHVLRDNRQLEYSNKFYALPSSPSCGLINWKVDQTARTLEGSCSHDFMPSAEPASVAAQAGHRGDDGATVVGPQEVDITYKPQISKKFISVAATQSSSPIDVSTMLPPDAGATYGSLLITNAAMQGRSEIESESYVGPSVAESPSLCTGKGDAQSPLTPQGGAGGDGGKGGDVEGMHRSRNLDTLTADID
ncbi:hypothetical protein CBR_g12417 [Chara braunii]|uniref:Uncharacterized protein n=1 Tax=Chara braunii TaxID=69332 RepID=A0A388JSB4_CHABU|nr:hypothetical protein CBR_g12417 [Chara braunii]|eukprot:GBG60681.1 hypothetical protein CBR_g12417 [Chara braunii]